MNSLISFSFLSLYLSNCPPSPNTSLIISDLGSRAVLPVGFGFGREERSAFTLSPFPSEGFAMGLPLIIEIGLGSGVPISTVGTNPSSFIGCPTETVGILLSTAVGLIAFFLRSSRDGIV